MFTKQTDSLLQFGKPSRIVGFGPSGSSLMHTKGFYLEYLKYSFGLVSLRLH